MRNFLIVLYCLLTRRHAGRESLSHPAYGHDAMETALTRFPNDPFVQKAKAESELFMRNLMGKRVHDA